MNPKLKLRQEQRFQLPFGFKLHQLIQQLQVSIYKSLQINTTKMRIQCLEPYLENTY